jgi:hypothetical protein
LLVNDLADRLQYEAGERCAAGKTLLQCRLMEWAVTAKKSRAE